MGITVTAKDLILRDLVGLAAYGVGETGIHITDDIEKSLINYTTGYVEGSLNGTPIFSNTGMEAAANANYMKTGIYETEQMTIASVVRFHSNNAFAASNHTGVGAKGIGLWRNSAGSLQFFADRAGELTAASLPNTIDQWILAIGSTSGANSTLKDLTNKRSAVSSITGIRNVRTNALNIGSPAGGSYTGTCEVLHTVFIPKAITPDEEIVLANFLRKYAATKGITV